MTNVAQDEINAAIEQRRGQWRSGWRRLVFPGIWLFYLGQTAHGVSLYSSGWAAAVGYALIAAFGATYLVALPATWIADRRRFWVTYLSLIAICAVESLFAHQDAFVMCVYIAVVTVAGLRRIAFPGIVVLTAVSMFVPPLIPAWHTGVDIDMAFTLPLVGVAMWGFFGIIRSNVELAAARSEVARLAAENERSRIARDLHDLLGHSLTTITVKAGLARRLSDRDPARAAIEIAEVEELTRSSLADVRAAVAGYRDVTVAGELASAREVLRAAGITADLPGAIDVVDPSVRELFGWVIREGITNVVRHSRATRCVITVGQNWVEIVDDGRGGIAGAGNGLAGLRERVEAAGGTASAGPARGVGAMGWRVRVDVPLDGAASSSSCAESPTMTA